MSYKILRYLCFSLFVLVLLIIESCEKEDNPDDLTNKVEFSDFTVSDISYKTAQVSSKIPETYGLKIEQFGHCWSQESNPDISDSISLFSEYSSNAFVSNLSGLTHNSTYYFRAYFKFGDVISYSEEISFKTLEIKVPEVTTSAYSGLTAISVQSGGEVINNNGGEILARGVCWNTSGSPDLLDSLTIDSLGLGIFESNIKNLEVNTEYYLRAYATNEVGTAFGDELSFTTKDGIPDTEIIQVLDLGAKSVNINVNINDDGGLNIIENGVCWSTSGDPTINDSILAGDTGLDNQVYNIQNLKHNTAYHIRAYVKNELGVFYGPGSNFTTQDGILDILTKDISEITSTSAFSGGEISDDEGLQITEKGVCWNTSGYPLIIDQKTIDGLGIGTFQSNINGLSTSTTYYVRAYAVNEVGVSYGNEIEFTSNDGKPVINTIDFSEITYSSLKSGGEIITDEGYAITEKGICWNTIGVPIVNDSKIDAGSGSGNFTSHITNLVEGETYYFRAYAINAVGIGYGNELNVSLVDGFVSVQDFDGNWYNTVKIGNQVWMKENLKTTHYANGEALIDGTDITATIDISDDYVTKYWFINTYPDGDEAFKETYGLLYTWAAAMNGSSSSDYNPSGIQGACPDGWHIPSDNEWSDLAANYGGGILNVGGPLKEIGYEHWNEPNAGATNESGFTALPAGLRHGNSYQPVGSMAYFWTSTEYNNDSTMYRACTTSYASLYHQADRKSSGFSVRCIKD